MNVSAVGGAASSHYADALRSALAAKAKAQTSAPLDSDGDHDGTKAGSGRIDVKA